MNFPNQDTENSDDLPLRKVIEFLVEQRAQKIAQEYIQKFNLKIQRTMEDIKMETEIGRIKKSEKVEIVVKLDEYDGKRGLNIREFVKSKKYTGFSKNGTRIPMERIPEFKQLINNIKI